MQCLSQTQAQPWQRGSKRLHNEMLLFCMQLQRGVARGLGVAQAMAAAQAPKLMVQQAELAEQTGRLDRCFLLLYHFYDTQAKLRLQRLNALLGPATLLLAALVLGLAFNTTLGPLYGENMMLGGV
jgi:type II secretory pathway component PulF